MVGSHESGRMMVMARLMEAGGLSQSIAEDIGHWKIAAQYVHRELREADEPNLLDEEDMQVFDLKPMTDPLHLVCCNACKKPVKLSQFAAHTEICKSLILTEEFISEQDGSTGHKKPPRKERKKTLSTNANQAASVGVREKFETIDGNDSAASEPHLDEQLQTTSAFAKDAKRNSSCVDGTLPLVGMGVNPGCVEYLTGSMPPPKKRSKLIAAEGLLISDHLETASGVTKSLCISTQEAVTCREYPNGSSAGSPKTYDHVIGCQMASQVHYCYTQTKDVLAPLATKIFYSQRNHRLRSALSHLYYETSTKEHCGYSVDPKGFHCNSMPSQTSFSENSSKEPFDDQQEKRDKHSFPYLGKPDEIHAQSSEGHMGKSGDSPPTINLSNQSSVNNVLGSHRAPLGMMRGNYLSNPYSFAGNSGKPLASMQQPKGSVPVT